jgi:hypothetical protein
MNLVNFVPAFMQFVVASVCLVAVFLLFVRRYLVPVGI